METLALKKLTQEQGNDSDSCENAGVTQKKNRFKTQPGRNKQEKLGK